MTKMLSMASHNLFNLGANEGFVIFLTFKSITCFIDGFTSKIKSQSIAYLLNGSEHIYWILSLEDEMHSQYGLYEQAAFKNARAILFFENKQSMDFIQAVKKTCLGWAPALGKCDLARGLNKGHLP